MTSTFPVATDWAVSLGSNVRIMTLSFAGEIGTVTEVRKHSAEVSLVDKTTGKRFEIDRLITDLEVMDMGPAKEPVFVGYLSL